MNPGLIASSYIKNSYLLNQFTGAYAAYSLRKLSSTYTGSCIKVVRDADNVEQDIGFVNNKLDTGSILSFIGNKQNLFRSSEPATDPGAGSRTLVTFSANTWGTITSASNPASISFTGTVSILPANAATSSNYTNVAALGGVANHSFTMYSISKLSGSTGQVIFGPTTGDYYHFMGGAAPGASFYSSQSLGNGYYLCRSVFTTTGTGVSSNYGIRKTNTGTANTVEVSGIMVTSGSTNYDFPAYCANYVKTVGTQLGSGKVSVWYDQSNNNRHFTSSAQTSQPNILGLSSVLGTKSFTTASNGTVGINQYTQLGAAASTLHMIMQNFPSASQTTSQMNDIQVYSQTLGSTATYMAFNLTPTRYYGNFNSGSISIATSNGAGTNPAPSYTVNSIPIPAGSTRGQGMSQIYPPTGDSTRQLKLLSATNVDLSTWPEYWTKPNNNTTSLNTLIEKILYTGSINSFSASLNAAINKNYSIY